MISMNTWVLLLPNTGLDSLNTFQVLPLIYSNLENHVTCCGERQGRMLVSSLSVLGYSPEGLGPYILTF